MEPIIVIIAMVVIFTMGGLAYLLLKKKGSVKTTLAPATTPIPGRCYKGSNCPDLLTNTNNTCFMGLQSDGNVVLYRKNANGTLAAEWSSGTTGTDGTPHVLIDPSNLNRVSVYNPQNILKQQSADLPSASYAKVTDDCAFAVFDSADKEIKRWGVGSASGFDR